MKLEGKWIELEAVVLSEVTQTQTESSSCFVLSMDVGFTLLEMCALFAIPTEAENLGMGRGGECNFK